MPTGRGWGCIATAATLLGAGAVLRVPELLEIGVALLALVLVQLVRVRLRRRDYTITRSIHPPRGVAGSPVTVEVTISSDRPGAPAPPGRSGPFGFPARAEGALLYTDPAPQALGGVRRFEVLLDGRGTSTVRYPLTPARRGRYVIGPGRLSSTDPFGLVRAPLPGGSPSTFVVFPRLEPLRGRAPVAVRNGGTSTASAASLAAGSEFFATREWRPGDDMRRIHWRSTARMGKVMVKQEELPKRDHATVVLDNRRASYADDWEGADAFERAVEAAASLVHHFIGEGFAVRLVMGASGNDGSGFGAEFGAGFGKGPSHHGLLMTALATVGLAHTALPQGPLSQGSADSESAEDGFVVLIGGVPEAAEGGRPATLRAGPDALVVITTPGSMAAAPALGGAGGSPHGVLHLPRGETLAAVWNGASATPRNRTRTGP
jgi:uncharacterized protein (DUF58 family)